MKLLGFTAQKPLYQAWQQDATMVWQWEFETYRDSIPGAGSRSDPLLCR